MGTYINRSFWENSMRNNRLVMSTAVTAAVIGMYAPSTFANKQKVYETQFTPMADEGLGIGGGSVPLTKASGVWTGPVWDRTTNPPQAPTSGLWNLASNWSGGIPNGPTDSATFNDVAGSVDAAGYTAYLTSGITLQTINNNTEAGTDIVSMPVNGTQTITMGTGGLTYNHNVTSFNLSLGETKFFTTGELLDASITGSGKFTKNGPGDLWMTSSSTYTGGTEINGGRVVIAGRSTVTVSGQARPAGVFDESVFGAGGTTLTINGGALYMRQDLTGGSNYTFNRPIVIGPNGADLQFDGEASPDINGIISGTGNIRLGDTGDAHYHSMMTYTGETIIDDYNFQLLIDNGGMPNSSAIRNFGRLDIVTNFSGSNLDRIGNSTPVTFYGGEMLMGGNDSFDASEKVGNIVLRNGMSVLTTDPKGTQLVTLGASAIIREQKSTLFIRGQNIGATTAGFARSRIELTTAPTLVGGLVPWATGATKDDPTMIQSVGIGLGVPVTYDVDGLRPLRPAELSANISAGGNVLATTSQAGNGTVNSLTMSNTTGNPAGGTITIGAGNLNITSGVLISNIVGNKIDSNVNFGAAEGVVHILSDVDTSGGADGTPTPVTGTQMSGVISGTGGLTKGGSGDLILSGANTYSGQTAITNGRLILTSDALPNVAGPLGNDNSAILISGSANSAADFQGIQTSLLNGTAGTVTIGRNIVIAGQSQANITAAIGGVGTTSYTKLNGNIDMGSTTANDVSGNRVTLTLQNGTIEVNGVISGPGMLQDDGVGTTVALNAANTYTGGTQIGTQRWAYTPVPAARYILGNNAAFGTGPVNVMAPTIFQASGGAKTIANDFTLYGDQLNFAGTDPLTFTGVWDMNQQTTGLNVGSTSLLTFNNTIKNGRVNKFGSGTMILNGADGISSVLQIGSAGNTTTIAVSSGGVVVARHPTALGSSGTPNTLTLILPGSTLQLDAANGNIASPLEEVQLDGAGSAGLGAINSVSGNNSLGTIELSKFINAGTFNPTNATINVAAGSSLTTGAVLDFSGPDIPPPNPNTNPATPTLRNLGSGVLTKSGAGLLTIAKVNNTKTIAGSLPITGGTALTSVLVLTKDAIGGLAVNDGTLRIAAGGTPNSADKLTVIKSLTIGATGKLDLTNNGMVIDYTGAVGTLVGDTRANLSAGRLLTSNADATHRLGYGDNAVLNKATFAGTAVDTSSLLVKFTYGGDANLDGQVDVTDLGSLATSWQTSAPWTGGDFNYDGFVDVSDLGILATDWQLGVGSPLGRGSLEAALASVGLGGTSVPEPATLGLVGLGLASLVARRRRRD
jgi:fibronectin-binding autotransporter adhesin